MTPPQEHSFHPLPPTSTHFHILPRPTLPPASPTEAGLNMLRLWGGASCDAAPLYDACDALGLLVWQEFWITGKLTRGLSLRV